MADYLYYRREDEWVRVDADTFTQELESTAGQGQGVFYRVDVVISAYQPSSGRTFGPRNMATGVYGPVVRVMGGNVYYPQNDSSTLGFVVAGHGNPARYSFFEESGAGYFGYAYSSGVRSYQPEVTARFVPALGGGGGLSDVIVNLDDVAISRIDGLPDQGGETCKTKFYRNGALVLTLNECPDVIDGPHDCSECCSQLLAIARNITV